MPPTTWRVLRILASVIGMWIMGDLLYRLLPGQSAAAAMIDLVCVLAIATLGDRVLAVATSFSASLSFSYYFIDSAGSFRISTTEGAVTFAAMVITALTASHLSLGLRHRAEESERRRNEMERLQQLSAALLGAETVNKAAAKAVEEIVRLFGGGACLTVEGKQTPFRAGLNHAATGDVVTVRTSRGDVLELYGIQPSVEVRMALANLMDLVLDRAAVAEERARSEAAQRGEELRTTILNALAHNFRTPLTSIKAAASMMRSSMAEDQHPESGVPTYSRELVEVIDEEADRLDELIRDSLDPIRSEARQVKPRMEPCSVAAVVRSVLEKMKRYLTQHSVILNFPEDLPFVRADRFLLGQMITQVVDNARKYAPAGGQIRISGRSADREVVLTIWNEGRQILEEERRFIFDRFYRGAETRATVAGTGLGLAIAKTIAEVHGGRVWLDAEPAGPAFCFALPWGEAEVEDDREPYDIAD